MTPNQSAHAALSVSAREAIEMGRAVYQLTQGPKEHRHTYHIHLLFVFGNNGLSRVFDEPTVKLVLVSGFDGLDVRYLGRFTHHPNWHPIADQVLVNLNDVNGVLRYGLYPGDGNGVVNYVDDYRSSGHPSYNPDGRYIVTDTYWSERGKAKVSVELLEAAIGRAWKLAVCDNVGTRYASRVGLENRREGESVVQAMARGNRERVSWQTQAHPAWSRCGRYVLFNSDATGQSQLYVIDVAEAIGGA